MLSGLELREAVIQAVRRDLCGPIVDESGRYPGAHPRIIAEGEAFADQDLTNGTFITADGNEVIRFIPASRYGVGVLYPALSYEVEEALDQELAREDVATDDVAIHQPVSSASNATGDLPLEPDEEPEGSAVRPMTMAISFVVTPGAELIIEVMGAAYEPFPVSVAGHPIEWWARHPLEEATRVVKLPEHPSANTLRAEPIQLGNLTLIVGVTLHSRPDPEVGQIVTCWLRNVSAVTDIRMAAASCLYQAELRVKLPTESLHDYRQPFGAVGGEDASLRLLYRHYPVKAIGHGCDASCSTRDGVAIIRSESLPVAQIPATSVEVYESQKSIHIGMAALANWENEAIDGIEHLLTGYESWIIDRHAEVEALAEVQRPVAMNHLAACSAFLADAREGWHIATNTPEVQQCLKWTSKAMADQQLAYRAATRSVHMRGGHVDVEGVAPADSDERPTWHPFQIAFLLSHIGSVLYEQHERRTDVDVVWMPTGGGKTEAYLALASFTMLWRRLSSNGQGGGTAVLMRYTLRLLTAQQLQRTASLICALERIRHANHEVLGGERFSVGAWLGAASTPNRRSDAVSRLNAYLRGTGERPFLLTRCPWCACDMTGKEEGLFGYRRQALQREQGSRVQARCPNPGCDFSLERDPQGLPVYEVDEDLYTKPPTFLLGTVDKFAMLAWQENARSFFGLGQRGSRLRPAPSLIIQDELHLITGPLGSLVGLYEGAVAKLCEHDGGLRPQIVTATATTRDYDTQVRLLFDASKARLIPPAGLTIDDSYFSHADYTAPPKAYIGVCAPGLGSFTRAEARVLASLAHAVGTLAGESADSADYYWSNLVFFGSLRDLGLSKSLISTDLRGFQYSLSRATGVRSGSLRNDGTPAAVRYLTDTELTSASSQSASDALNRLQRRRDEDDCVDLALATSVIEVGVDVSRLGLLTVIRQPKTVASYIQVTGRVGRSVREGPGLVVVLLDPRRGRDLSHYERFSAFHHRLFASVEPASVTPFTNAAVERGLRGTISAVVRQTRLQHEPLVGPKDIQLADEAAGYLEDRASALDPRSALGDEWALARNDLVAAIRAAISWGNAGPATQSQFLRRPETPVPPELPSWAAPTSLRNVDNIGGLRVEPQWLPPVDRAQRAINEPVSSQRTREEGTVIEW